MTPPPPPLTNYAKTIGIYSSTGFWTRPFKSVSSSSLLSISFERKEWLPGYLLDHVSSYVCRLLFSTEVYFAAFSWPCPTISYTFGQNRSFRIVAIDLSCVKISQFRKNSRCVWNVKTNSLPSLYKFVRFLLQPPPSRLA